VPLRLAHVSDIHFRGYGGGWDLNADQRRELLADVARLVNESGRIDGILVGGDIAFHASDEEYGIAGEWLDNLRLACGSPAPPARPPAPQRLQIAARRTRPSAPIGSVAGANGEWVRISCPTRVGFPTYSSRDDKHALRPW
jgi:3',5'-cyclic AMP phosphodiesterase CpdA